MTKEAALQAEKRRVSFLEHQKQMGSRCGKNNAVSLSGLNKIPTTPQILTYGQKNRNILDEIATVGLFQIFTLIPNQMVLMTDRAPLNERITSDIRNNFRG